MEASPGEGPEPGQLTLQMLAAVLLLIEASALSKIKTQLV
jgi:hypothetical protein